MDEDSIGFRIRRARSYRGLSQAELARQVGISATALNAIERGRTPAPRSTLIQQIARTLNVSADFLLGLSDTLPQEGASVASIADVPHWLTDALQVDASAQVYHENP